MKYGFHRTHGAEHSAKCRERIYEKIAQTVEGRERLARMDERFNRYMELKKLHDENLAQGEEKAVPGGPDLDGPTPFETFDDASGDGGELRMMPRASPVLNRTLM